MLLPLLGKLPSARYCSGRCRQDAFRQRHGAAPSVRRHSGQKRSCVRCGRQFLAWTNLARFCSEACKTAAWRQSNRIRREVPA